MSTEERLKILDMLRQGTISADDAEKLLTALGDEPLTEDDDHQVVILPKGENQGITRNLDIPNVEGFWKYIMAVGSGIFLLFGLLMTSITGFFALMCFGPFALAGFGIAALGMWSRDSHWLHVHVKEKDGNNIRISLPLPLGMAGWIMRLVQPVIRQRVGNVNLQKLDLASFITAMGDELSPENPIMVVVDDDDDQVLVYIT